MLQNTGDKELHDVTHEKTALNNYAIVQISTIMNLSVS